MSDEKDKPENVVNLKVVPKGESGEGEETSPPYTADNVLEELHGQGMQELALVAFDEDGTLNIAGNTSFDRLFFLFHRGANLAMAMEEAYEDEDE